MCRKSCANTVYRRNIVKWIKSDQRAGTSVIKFSESKHVMFGTVCLPVRSFLLEIPNHLGNMFMQFRPHSPPLKTPTVNLTWSMQITHFMVSHSSNWETDKQKEFLQHRNHSVFLLRFESICYVYIPLAVDKDDATELNDSQIVSVSEWCPSPWNISW